MGAKEFGQLVAERMDELGFSQNKVARRFGELPDGRGLDSSQVRVIKEGGRRLDHALVQRLIQVLELDQNLKTELRAWRAAGLWPEHLGPEDIASELMAARQRTAAGRVALPEGAAASASPSSSQRRDSTSATLFTSARRYLPRVA